MKTVFCVLYPTCKLRNCTACFYIAHIRNLLNEIINGYGEEFLKTAKNTTVTKNTLLRFSGGIYDYISKAYLGIPIYKTPNENKHIILQENPCIHLTYDYFPHLKSQGHTVHITMSMKFEAGTLEMVLIKVRIRHLQLYEDNKPYVDIHTRNSWGTYYTMLEGCNA